jgi:predicted Zn-dependent peptidase
MTLVTPLNPYAPSRTVLPNGVSLLNAPSASRNVGVFLIVRAGSRDETADTSGLAHYLEHMFFKGTARRPTTLQISREIDRLGANTNAYTDTEEVAYYAEGPATALDDLTDIITDMLTRPLFAADEVERERNVVLQELSARLSDPEGWIWDRLGTVAFGGDQPMAWSAAGFPSVIEKASRDQLLDYHASFYAPESPPSAPPSCSPMCRRPAPARAFPRSGDRANATRATCARSPTRRSRRFDWCSRCRGSRPPTRTAPRSR